MKRIDENNYICVRGKIEVGSNKRRRIFQLNPRGKVAVARFAFINAAYVVRAFRVQPVIAGPFVALLATYCEPISKTTEAKRRISRREGAIE